jgi:hypothetical protein
MFGTSMPGCKLPSPLPDPWSDERLLQTVANYGGVGDDANQSDDVRFLRGVARLVKKRLRTVTEPAQTPAVFLLCPTEPLTVDRERLESYPMLDNGLTPVEGRLWLVSPVVTRGKCLPLDVLDDSGLFEIVVSKLEQGAVPAVIYDPRTDPAQIRYYYEGMQDPDKCKVIDIPVAVVDLQQVLDVVDRVYETRLVTPNAQSQVAKLWEDTDRYWVAKDAELTIQMYLETAFSVAFPTCTVRSEQSQVTGRLDIEIEESDSERPGYVIRHALLELKVLRSFGSTGAAVTNEQVRTWIDEGVDQAFSYRDERGTLQSALCCFDMRKSHTGIECFKEVAEKAKSLRVTIRVWNLFSSAKAYRAFRSSRLN